MAGFYMDAPNDRVAWDRDGSVLTYITDGGSVLAQSASVRRALNSESESGTATISSQRRVAVVFPVPMDCSAVFLATNFTTPLVIETSKDTTNGLDGTWSSQFLTGLNTQRDVKPNYRLASALYLLQPNSTSSDLRGIRFSGVTNNFAGLLRAFHIYGTPSSAATTDRLALWHPTNDVKVPPTWFDWGNVPRSSSADRLFRIKNLSADLYAQDIDVYIDALTPGTPSVVSMHTLSEDNGVSFFTGLNLASLAPGEISPVLILRRVVPADALVSVWSARIAADVNLWSSTP